MYYQDVLKIYDSSIIHVTIDVMILLNLLLGQLLLRYHDENAMTIQLPAYFGQQLCIFVM